MRYSFSSVCFFPTTSSFLSCPCLVREQSSALLLVLQKAFWSAGADAREQMRCWCKLGLGCWEPIGAPCSGAAFNSYFKKKRLKLEGLWRADEGSGEESFILFFSGDEKAWVRHFCPCCCAAPDWEGVQGNSRFASFQLIKESEVKRSGATRNAFLTLALVLPFPPPQGFEVFVRSVYFGCFHRW